jgi:hypothetical protein
MTFMVFDDTNTDIRSSNPLLDIHVQYVRHFSCATEVQILRQTKFPFKDTSFPPEAGVGQTQAWMPAYASILSIEI